MAKPISIGLKWTLRFTLATMVVVSLVALYHYELVENRIRSDARVLLELQAEELVEAWDRYARREISLEDLVDYVDGHIDSAQDELKLGIRIHDSEGAVVLERGIFLFREFPEIVGSNPLPTSTRISQVDVGEKYAYTVMTKPLASGFVEVAISSRRFTRALLDLRNSFLMSFPVALVLTALLGWWLARRSLRPIASITETARRITVSQLEEKLPISGSGDELDSLAQTLNEMMARIRAGVARVRAFSSNAAHQLRTPVSLLRSRLDIAATADRDPVSDQRLIEAALRDVERIGEAIRGMLRLADSEAGLTPEGRKPVELFSTLADVVEFFEPVAADEGIRLSLDATEPATVSGDPEWLNELFSNLIDNALKYTEAGGSVSVTTRREGARVAVAIRDTGHGIPADELDRVFERFQRGRREDQTGGAGLGLAVALEIARAHGGRIEVESAPGRGTTFTTWLPLSGKDSQG
jgi:heavy metal sensor kinase